MATSQSYRRRVLAFMPLLVLFSCLMMPSPSRAILRRSQSRRYLSFSATAFILPQHRTFNVDKLIDQSALLTRRRVSSSAPKVMNEWGLSYDVV